MKKILLFGLIAMILFLVGCTHTGSFALSNEKNSVQILSPMIVAYNSSSKGYTIQDDKGNSIGTIPGGYSYIGIIGDNAVFVDKIKAELQIVDIKTGTIESNIPSLLENVPAGFTLGDVVYDSGRLWYTTQSTAKSFDDYLKIKDVIIPGSVVISYDVVTEKHPFEEAFLAEPSKKDETASAFICAIDKTNIAVLMSTSSQSFLTVHSIDHNTSPKEINVDKSVALPFLSEPVDKFTMIPLLSADRKTLYRIGITKDGELTRFTGTIHLQGTEQLLQAKDNYIIAFTETALTAYSGGNDKSFETNIRDIPTIHKNYVFYVRGNSVFANQLGTKEEINICSIGNVKVVAMRVIDQKLLVAFDQNGKISLQEFVIPTTIVFNP